MAEKVDALVKEVTGQDTETLKNKILNITKGYPSYSLLDICRQLDASVRDIEDAVVDLNEDGYDISVEDHSVNRTFTPPPGFEKHLFNRVKRAKEFKFGVISDTHYGNVKSRQDVIEAAYDHFEAEKITAVYHCGNMIDGYHPRFNHNELIADCFDLEGQLAYAANHYPRKKGVTTYYIAAEDHEGWWHRKSGINIGRVMQMYFHDTFDRPDLECIGFGEADIELRVPGMAEDVSGPIMRVIHPGGGTAYALSYKTQKMAESLQGGEKPQIHLVGHFHKFDYNFHREVHNIMVGCFKGQTRVETPNGPVPISSINVGDKVITHTGAHKKVKKVYTHKWADKWAVVRYGNGGNWCRVTATINHPFLVRRAGELVQVAAGNLLPGDVVLTTTTKCKQCGAVVPHYRELCMQCNPADTEEVKARIAASKTKSGEFTTENRRSNRGFNESTGRQHYLDHIEPQVVRLEQQGFRVFPIGPVVPDIIALKDGKAFAVEVESGLRVPDYEKYERTGMDVYYDDFMWILPEREKRNGGSWFEVDKETGMAAVEILDVQIKDKLRQDREYETVYNLEVEDDHTFIAGRVAVHNCAEDQTLFMRKTHIPAHVGYCIIEAHVEPGMGILEKVKLEWVPWYDKGFYQKWSKVQ